MALAKAAPELAKLLQNLREGNREISFAVDLFAEDFVLSPGKITIIGAPPGTGKTALASQICFDALKEHPELNLVNANCEMVMETIFRREISRSSGVAHKKLLQASFDDGEFDRVMIACNELAQLAPRIKHVLPPFDTASLTEVLLLEPGLLVVDYLQKFRASDRDARTGVDEVCGTLRTIAMAGWSVLAMSATTRQHGGHDPKALSMSSFKESGEIEFNADAAYVLRDLSSDAKAKVKDIELDCVKNRAGCLHSIDLRFCGDYMRFEGREPVRYAEFDDFNSGGFVGGFPAR